MKKNQAREFACKVKWRYDQYHYKEDRRIDLSYYVSEISKKLHKLKQIGLINIYKNNDKSSVYKWRILPDIQRCLLFLYKYQNLDRNLYDPSWIHKQQSLNIDFKYG